MVILETLVSVLEEMKVGFHESDDLNNDTVIAIAYNLPLK